MFYKHLLLFHIRMCLLTPQNYVGANLNQRWSSGHNAFRLLFQILLQ